MFEKTVKFLVILLEKVKRLIPTHHCSGVELDSKCVSNVILNYVDKHGVSEFIYLLTATILFGSSILLFIVFMSIIFL